MKQNAQGYFIGDKKSIFSFENKKKLGCDSLEVYLVLKVRTLSMDLGEMGLWFSSLNIIDIWFWTVKNVSFIMCKRSRWIPASTLPVSLMIQYKHFSKNTL